VEDAAGRVLPALVDRAYLQPEVALALLRLIGEDTSPAPAALRIIEWLRQVGAPARPRVGQALRHMSLLIRCDLLPATRLQAARKLESWAQQHGLHDMPGMPELGDLASFADQLDGLATRANETDFADTRQRKQRTAALVDGARADSVAQLHDRLKELLALWAGEQEIERYLARLGCGLAPSQRVGALNALASVPAEDRLWRFQGEALLRTLGTWLSQWHNSGPVRSWADAHLGRLLRDNFVNFVAYEQTADITLPLVMALPAVSDPSTLLVQALGPNLGRLRAGQLHAIARALAKALTPQEQADALEWSLDRLEQGEPPRPVPELPSDSAGAVAALLWALFGHPDKRVRWRAAHAAREILAAPDRDTATALMAFLGQREAGAFAGEGHEFLWMSAELWLVAVLARAADEAPASLSGHEQRLAELALDRDWPHAAVREFARRAALRLDEHARHSLHPDVREQLLNVNRAVACHVQRGRGWSGHDGNRTRANERFWFNSMDTLPYWYRPLGNVFALGVDEIAARAERWIVDRLYYTDDSANEVGSRRRRRDDYDETGHSHGSQPRVERLRTYLEYHAMLLVAGELVAEGAAISIDSYDHPADPWVDWLAGHLDASPDRWTVDLRRPAPLEPESYGVLGPLERWRQRTPQDFDEQLGLGHGGSASIVVDASCEVSAPDRYGDSFVSSALITPNTADALLRALQTCKDPTDFRLPEERLGDYPDDVEIDEPGFQLLGWTREHRQEDEGLEKHDPLRRMQLTFTSLGHAIIAQHRLREADGGRTLLASDGRAVSWVEEWSDRPLSERRYQRPGYSEGRRTWVVLPYLLTFLVARQMDLIFEVRITRQYAERARVEKEDRYERGESRIYLLRGNGALETMGGHRQLG
jgi:hypothetical protein